MKCKLLAIVSLFFIPLIINAQNANVAVQPTPEKTQTKITGRLIYEDTGKPVRRGLINFLKIDEKNVYDNVNDQVLERVSDSNAFTNDDGEFVIDSVEAGEYYPEISVPGVLNPSNFSTSIKADYKFNLKKLDQLFEKIVVVEGVKEQNILIRARRGGAIGGRIVYSDGEPVTGAEVQILAHGEYGFETVSNIKTDDRGFYRFSSLAPNEYLIRVIEPTFRKLERNYAYFDSATSELKTYFGDTNSLKEAKIVELSMSEEKAEINITIPDRQTYSIKGTVVSKTNRKPVRNAIVSLEKNEETEALRYTVRSSESKKVSTDEKGNFSISDLPKGTYTFNISPPSKYRTNSSSETSPSKPEPTYVEMKKEIVIEDKNLENVEFELPLASKISGVLMFEDKREIKDIFLAILDDETQQITSTFFDAGEYVEARKAKPNQWNFVLSEIPEGNYFPYIAMSGGLEDFYVKSVTVGGKDWLNSPLEIKENSDITDVKIILGSDVGTIKGKVETTDDKLLDRALIFLIPSDKPNATRLTRFAELSENGEFSKKLAPGEYYLAVYPLNILSLIKKLKQPEWFEKFTKEAEKITIKANETTTVNIKK